MVTGIFEESKLKKKGFAIGCSRSRAAAQGPLSISSKYVPGPGQYEIPSTLAKKSISMKARHEPRQADNQPGPGLYNCADLFRSEGRLLASKYRSGARAPILGRLEAVSVSQVPGPGSYHPRSQQSFKLLSFAHADHKRRVLEASPGPGTYSFHSEFARLKKPC
jgi:hypothetical protein